MRLTNHPFLGIGRFPSLHHRKEVSHENKWKTTPAASASVAARNFLDDAATPPCGRGLCPTEENALTVGAVYDRPFFLDSTKYGRSWTAPTVANFGSGDLLGKAHHRKEGNNA